MQQLSPKMVSDFEVIQLAESIVITIELVKNKIQDIFS